MGEIVVQIARPRTVAIARASPVNLALFADVAFSGDASDIVSGVLDASRLPASVLRADGSAQVTGFIEFLGSSMAIANGSAGRHLIESDATSGQSVSIPDAGGRFVIAQAGYEPSGAGELPFSSGSGGVTRFRLAEITDVSGLQAELDARPIVVSGEFGSGSGGSVTLSSLSDVTISSPANLQLLIYDSGSSEWVNGSMADAGFGSAAVEDASAFAAAAHTHVPGDITGLGSAALEDASAFAAASHTHDLASDVTGVLPVANGGTGGSSLPSPSNYTPSGATIAGHLSGIDAALLGGGGGSPAIVKRVVRQVSEQSVENSTVLVDTDLTLSVEANKEYRFEFVLRHNAAASCDAKFGLSLPAGATATWFSGYGSNQGVLNEGNAPTSNGSGSDRIAAYIGIVSIAGTAGNMTIQFAQATAVASVFATVRAGGWMTLEEIG